MSDWREVSTALLGSWPSQVAGWGKEGIAAYIGELQARGLTPDDALRAIRISVSGFAPSAPKLAADARADTERPIFIEVFERIYGRRGLLRARPPGPSRRYASQAEMAGAYDDAARARAYEIHALLGAFVDSFGITRLRMLAVDHEEYGDIRRRELQDAWQEFTERDAERTRAKLSRPRTPDLARGPRKLNPMAGIAPIAGEKVTDE